MSSIRCHSIVYNLIVVHNYANVKKAMNKYQYSRKLVLIVIDFFLLC